MCVTGCIRSPVDPEDDLEETTGMSLDPSLLRSLPKVLLHEHLDGVLRPRTLDRIGSSVRLHPIAHRRPR